MDSAFIFRRWGEEEQARWNVEQIAETGVDLLYLRVRQCQCYYNSKLDFVGVYFDPDDNNVQAGHGWGMPADAWEDWNEWIHFGPNYFQPSGTEWDAAASYVKLAHEYGLKVYAFMEQAEAHGWGWNSGFSRQHPEYLTRNRDGEVCEGTLSYAYPEVVEFKLNLLREVLAYGFDGLGINLHKGGDHRHPRWQDGVFYAHYDLPIVEAFRRERTPCRSVGRDPFRIPPEDPEWVRFRARYVTEFMRQASRLVRTEYPGVEFGAFGMTKGQMLPTGHWYADGGTSLAPARSALEANLEDHEDWTQEGPVDFLLAEAVGDYAWERILPDFRRQVKDPHCRVGVWQIAWDRAEQALEDAKRAVAAGAQEVHFFQWEPFLPGGLPPYDYRDHRAVLKQVCEFVHYR
jgi:hypothetical protein